MASKPLAPYMHHIDRRDLYTNLEARIHYLHSFLDFSSHDIAALISGSKYIKALIPAVVNIVYKKLLQYDITARAFTTRSTSYEGPVDDIPAEDSPQIKYRKMFLRGYLMKLCSDPTRMEFWEYLDKVGMMHVGQGRKHPLHVEYIHIGACLGFIGDILNEAILSHPRLLLDRKIALVKALGKVLWIQNDLFAKWYVRDGEEYKDEEPEVEIEKEGYLHGKRVVEGEDFLDLTDEPEGREGGEKKEGEEKGEGIGGKKTDGNEPTTPTSPNPITTTTTTPKSPSERKSQIPTRCPFSGMSASEAEQKLGNLHVGNETKADSQGAGGDDGTST